MFGTFAMCCLNLFMSEQRTSVGTVGSIHTMSLELLPKVAWKSPQLLSIARMPFGRHVFQTGLSGLLASKIMIDYSFGCIFSGEDCTLTGL